MTQAFRKNLLWALLAAAGMAVAGSLIGRSRRPVETNSQRREERLRILESHLKSLREEISSRLETQNTLWRALVAGLAAVIILDKDVDVTRFLPLVPILGAVLLAVWLNNQFLIARGGLAMKRDEEEINEITGRRLLRHEMDLWNTRQEVVLDHVPLWWMVLLLGVVALFLGIALFWELPKSSALPRTAGVRAAVYGVAGAVTLIATVTFTRLVQLYRENRVTISDPRS
jgi:hypothetical protein